MQSVMSGTLSSVAPPPIGIDDDAEIKVAAVPFAIGRDGPKDVHRPHSRVIRKDVSEPIFSGLGKHDNTTSGTTQAVPI